MEKSQREYYLNEQMKAIQKELGETEDGVDEFEQLQKKIDDAKMPAEAKKRLKLSYKIKNDVTHVSGSDCRARLYRLDGIGSMEETFAY